MLKSYEEKGLVKLETAQEKYGFPHPGKCENKDCETYILTITNFNNDLNKPSVYLSGTIHGDERVGPNASMETALLLL